MKTQYLECLVALYQAIFCESRLRAVEFLKLPSFVKWFPLLMSQNNIIDEAKLVIEK